MNGKRVTVYIDVSIMKLLLFLTGIQRVVREEILQLYDYDDIDLCFLAYDEKKQGYNILPPRKLLNSLRPGNYADKDLKNENSRRFIMPDEMESGSVFFDLDAAWMCRMKRSYLYPVLKKNGVLPVSSMKHSYITGKAMKNYTIPFLMKSRVTATVFPKMINTVSGQLTNMPNA